ncbi:MAG: aldehyde dehydrogenase family protein, partial [Cupriavidus sp.]
MTCSEETTMDLPTHDLLIDGKRLPPTGGNYSTDINPADEAPLARVAQGTAADVDLAVQAARRALKVWNGMRAAERARILNRFADLLEANAEELITLESLDGGKPLASVRRQDVPAVIDTVRYYAGWCDKIHGSVIPARTDALTYTVREPVGVVAAIVPWNFPLMIGMWKMAPALACGCTLIVKPAEITPLTALRVAELALEAGLPPGVLNIVTG